MSINIATLPSRVYKSWLYGTGKNFSEEVGNCYRRTAASCASYELLAVAITRPGTRAAIVAISPMPAL
ncbi:MAG TPA: hypothetical protein VIH18_28925 [Candidatus Binatia bacterium]